ncbi:hypothetical protein ACOSP7_026686 [Xanthoceras sorbifolium]
MEPSHFEAALDGNVNKFPFCDIKREDLSEIFKNVSPSRNSLLHVASSSGHDQDMTQLIARKFLFLIAKKNSEGNTVLHLVVRAQKLNTIIILNDKGITALHEALFAVHASKKNVNILVDVACYLVLNDPNITCHQNNADHEEGNTPLHFAADIGYIEGVRYLIEIKSNWAFERNNKGFYPLHLACENGHVQVTKELFRRWPDPIELLCDKGQSILHEKGTDKLVNKMDKNGRTPFHLAALHCHSMVLFTLLCDKRSKADLVNCQGLTAYDSFKSNILTKLQDQQIDVNDRNIKASGTVEENSVDVGLKTSKKLKKFQMIMTYSMLYMSHEFFWCGQTKRHHQNSTTTMSQFKIKPTTPKQELNNTINYLFVVAALVVGAAFSGALQIPYDDLALTFMGSAFYYAMVLRTQNIDDGWSLPLGYAV